MALYLVAGGLAGVWAVRRIRPSVPRMLTGLLNGVARLIVLLLVIVGIVVAVDAVLVVVGLLLRAHLL